MLIEGNPPHSNPEQWGNCTDRTGEKLLIWQIQHGTAQDSSVAMQNLVEYCLQIVVPYVDRKIYDQMGRDDIVQETCIHVVQRIHLFEYRGIPLAHWFKHVAKLKYNEHQRRHYRDGKRLIYESDLDARHSDYEGDVLDRLKGREQYQNHQAQRYLSAGQPEIDLLDIPIDLTDIERDRLVHAAIHALADEIKRRVLMLIYFSKKNSTQIATLLGTTPGNVRQIHRRALAELRRLDVLRQLFDDLSLY